MQGVGVAHPDESHFAMSDRWATGDADGTGAFTTGFFGRLADVIGGGGPAVAVSLDGPSRSIDSAHASTISLSDPAAGSFLIQSDDRRYDAYQAGFSAMRQGNSLDSAMMTAARRGITDAANFARRVGTLPAPTAEYPNHPLAQSLSLAATLLSAEIGTRIVHVNHGGAFDTHENHLAAHADNMTVLDESVDAFLRDMAAKGLADRTVVMTTSEFGRRAKDNGSAGLDHGAGSVALLVGAVRPGLYGEYPSLRNLDDNDNLVATMNLTEYYATVAEVWLGVHASDVLAGSPMVVPGVF